MITKKDETLTTPAPDKDSIYEPKHVERTWQLLQLALGSLFGGLVMLIVAWFGFKGADEQTVKELIAAEREKSAAQSQLQILQQISQFDIKLNEIRVAISAIEKSQIAVSKDVEQLQKQLEGNSRDATRD